jgi:hypothetical protein
VWVIQRRNGARFALEPATDLVRADLDRDAAIEPRVARLVDFAHPTGANRRQDLVRPEASTDGKGHEHF